MATGPIALDNTGVREMLAGFELELGDERAKTAQQKTRADLSEDREKKLRAFSDEQQSRAIWVPAIAGAGGVALGILLGFVIGGHR